MDLADDDIREATLSDVSEDTRQLAAGLAYSGLHPDMPWTNYIYDWQPFLQHGIELGLFTAGALSSDLVAALWNDEDSPTPEAIEDLLVGRVGWVDDVTLVNAWPLNSGCHASRSSRTRTSRTFALSLRWTACPIPPVTAGRLSSLAAPWTSSTQTTS